MHDLNSAANTDDSSGIDSAANSSDFEVNMIIKEFESEFLLQVCASASCVACCVVVVCLADVQSGAEEQCVWNGVRDSKTPQHIASQRACFGGVCHN